ncbi:hypothetical protein NL108_018525 [Boleophthalmus pectinirostris]|nr:hypothetical protein NL108_018525 [Boleophthalmus pectinirostris]
MRQLSDNTFYEKLPSNPTDDFKNSIHEALSVLLQNGEISENEYSFLKVDYPIIPTFYILPKIHKSLENPPGRPIVASIGSITSNLSIFIDSIIRPAAEALPSFIKDTGHMINFVESIDCVSNEEEWYLVSFDINSMYTSIPHDGVLRQ